jgi:proteic killer suppression protein
MIVKFNSKLAEDIFNGIASKQARKLPVELHGKAQRLLDQLNSITRIETLRVPPSNNLEKLKGNLAGYWSIRINQQWRIIFQWDNGEVNHVDIVDYH